MRSCLAKILPSVICLQLSCAILFGAEALICKPTFFPKEAKSGRQAGGVTAPPGALVEVLQENRLSVFVAWGRNRAWVDRSNILRGESPVVRIKSAPLAADAQLRQAMPAGPAKPVEVRRNTEVDVLDQAVGRILVRYKNACGWIPETAVGAPDTFARKVQATTDEFTHDSEVPEAIPSQMCPELAYEKLVPFEIVSRITSLRHYDVKSPKNGYHTEALSFADYNLVWGPLLEDYSVETKQGHRMSSSKYTTALPRGVGPLDYCHNFHIVCDSEEIKAMVLAAKPGDFVTLTGSLVQVLGNPSKFRNPSRWTSSIAGEYCYVLLVESMVNHGSAAPRSTAFTN